MYLGLTDVPFVPHNLTSAHEIPVLLTKFQIAPRFEFLMSSGSYKRTKMYFIFLSKRPGNRIYSGSQTGPLWREIPAYRACLHIWWYTALSQRHYKKSVPPVFPKTVTLRKQPPIPKPYLTYFSGVPSRGGSIQVLLMEIFGDASFLEPSIRRSDFRDYPLVAPSVFYKCMF
jgi:hypothetical protein